MINIYNQLTLKEITLNNLDLSHQLLCLEIRTEVSLRKKLNQILGFDTPICSVLKYKHFIIVNVFFLFYCVLFDQILVKVSFAFFHLFVFLLVASTEVTYWY